MIFELVYKTNHNFNQKEVFLSDLELIENKYIDITDITYTFFKIKSFKYTVDRFFIVTIEAVFEDYSTIKTSEIEKIEIIKKYFPTFLKINII